MQREIQPIADQLSVLNRRAEKLLEPIETQPKEKKSVTRPSEILSFPDIHEGLGQYWRCSENEDLSIFSLLSGRKAGRVSGDIEVLGTLVLVFAPLHRREKLAALAKAFNFGNDIQVGDTRSVESPPKIEIPSGKHPGVRQAA